MFPEIPPQPASVDAAPTIQVAAPIVLPPRLPAHCFLSAARDYVLPATVLVAIVKVESGGRSVSHVNTDKSVDFGVSQINDRSWGRYMWEHFRISSQAILTNACQAVRVMAYVLRSEMNHHECRGVDLWCAVGRYHAPNNWADRSTYVPKVQSALAEIERTRRFE